ncbi:hypothetical protein EZV62_018148 [Acer yangbiense]|uniref:CCHC-type domain-containing protein n=1 Tax=Acer yangbiense TaxID=1000413 RepID=A0A5C7HJ98_9ROSI|nr:hypothetical protein EZV62_018148 [Acer yangbiense]
MTTTTSSSLPETEERQRQWPCSTSMDFIQDGVEDMDRCLVGKVISGKRVNREAFKGLIEQIWNQFGQVDVELVGENTFMFYFTNKEDRNKFNEAKLWVQIHDIPIMCMNRRTTKWLAEHIGEVVEIPVESRECWGKFIRVKVRLDITKPLKRWLRIGKNVDITRVALKYERLPDFCFACRRIGHSLNECLDEEAKKTALEGQLTKFGSWLRVVPVKKSNAKSTSLNAGSSSEKGKSVKGSSENEGDGSLSIRSGNAAFQKSKSKSDSGSVAATEKIIPTENRLETLETSGLGPAKLDEIWVDKLEPGQEKAIIPMGLPESELLSRKQAQEKEPWSNMNS